MTRHAAYGLSPAMLDIILVDDSKPMLQLMRSVLASMQPARIRAYESPEDALKAMLSEPPNLVITDWRMKPLTGYQLLRTMRNREMAPLCFVPVIMVTAYGTRALCAKAFSAGAQQVLVKPLSPATLVDRVMRLLRDGRPLVPGPDDRYVIAGVGEALEADETRTEMLERARAFVDRNIRTSQAQAVVDRILSEPEQHGEAPRALFVPPARRPEPPQRRVGFASVNR